jgi:mutator protein MutT
MRDIVNAVLLRQGDALLARRSPLRKAYPDLWSFPGGHVEAGESLEQALVRECREEIGIEPVTYVAIGCIADPNASVATPVTYHMYAVTVWTSGEPTIRDDEHIELKWFRLDVAVILPDLALEEYRRLLSLLTRDYRGTRAKL